MDLDMWNTPLLRPIWMHFWSQRLRRYRYLILNDLAEVIRNPKQPFEIAGWRSIKIRTRYNFKSIIRFSLGTPKSLSDLKRSYIAALIWCRQIGCRNPDNYLVKSYLYRFPQIDITAVINHMAEQYEKRKGGSTAAAKA